MNLPLDNVPEYLRREDGCVQIPIQALLHYCKTYDELKARVNSTDPEQLELADVELWNEIQSNPGSIYNHYPEIKNPELRKF